MKIALSFFLTCMAIVAFGIAATSTGFHEGDCISVPKNEHVFKVVQVGKYGIKAIQPHYDGFEDVYLDQDDLKEAKRMDCFDLFKLQEK